MLSLTWATYQVNELQHEYQNSLSELNSEQSGFYACVRWASVQFKVEEREKNYPEDQERTPGSFKW